MALPILNTDRKKRRSNEPNSLMLGKVPPQAKELEEAILGAIMLETGAFDTASELIKAECFYVDAHQRIFLAMQGLVTKKKPIDIFTVVEELKYRDELEIVGGPYYVQKLTNVVVSSANIETHARIVLQKFIQRELIRISGEIINEAYEDSSDVFDMLDDAEGKLFEITKNHIRKESNDINSILLTTIEKIDDMRSRNDELTGVPTGFPSLDKITYGWQKTDLIILAARPSVGKTAFALNLARRAALMDKGQTTRPTATVFFSLEMSSSQLVTRILAAESEIPLEKITRGKLEDHEMAQLSKKGVDRLTDAPIFIDDSAALNIFELRAKCRRLKTKNNIGLIIIDYLQLMSGSNDKNSNREQEISKISRDLKGLAKELEIPIIALSQLSREVEKRKDSDKVPQLSDLRESGAIEQDADMVMFLYRPEYNGVTADADGQSTKGQTFVKIAKHRNGSLETIKLRAELSIQKFFEDDGDNEHIINNGKGKGFNSGFKSLGSNSPANNPDGEGATLYREIGSRMNEQDFNDEDAPF
jgi:replicative DNA helicase